MSSAHTPLLIKQTVQGVRFHKAVTAYQQAVELNARGKLDFRHFRSESSSSARLSLLWQPAVVEQTMMHFYLRAMQEKSLGAKCNEARIDAALEKAASWATKILPYHRARLMAIKLAGDPTNPLWAIRDDITADELRAQILSEMRRLGLFDDLAAVPVPEGAANREMPAKDGTA